MSNDIQLAHDANANRYMNVAAAIILLYDHLLTFADEVDYLWGTPPSALKRIFFVYRYSVPCLIITVVIESCGFTDFSFTNHGCQIYMSFLLVSGILSIKGAGWIVLNRVVALWQGNKAMRVMLFSVFYFSCCVLFAMTVSTIVLMTGGFRWTLVGKMCDLVGPLPVTWSILWGAPMIFDVVFLVSVVYNVFATPRSAQFPLRQALQNDGLIFFLTTLILRVVNMITSSALRPSLTTIASFMTWALIATAFSRSLFRTRTIDARTRQHRSNYFEANCSRSMLPGVQLSEIKPVDGQGEETHEQTWASNGPERC